MSRKILSAIMVWVCFAGAGWAEAMRTVYTKENKLPEKFAPEVGGEFSYRSFKETQASLGKTKEYSEIPYVRFGLLENLALQAKVPCVQVRREMGSNDNGIGDVELGLDFRAWEDIFRYPWILPHASVKLDTGDENKGTGAGETITTVGVSAGTTVEDVFNFAVDGRYEINGSAYGHEENVASVALSIVWDLSEEFALLAEGKLTNDDSYGDSNTAYYHGGFSYLFTEKLMLAVYGGAVQNTDEDFYGRAKLSYSF